MKRKETNINPKSKRTKTVREDLVYNLSKVPNDVLVYMMNVVKEIPGSSDEEFEYLLSFVDLSALACTSKYWLSLFNKDEHDLWGQLSSQRSYFGFSFIKRHQMVKKLSYFPKAFQFALNEGILARHSNCQTRTSLRVCPTRGNSEQNIPISVFLAIPKKNDFLCIDKTCNHRNLETDAKICGYSLMGVFDACTTTSKGKTRQHKWKSLPFDMTFTRSKHRTREYVCKDPFHYCGRCGILKNTKEKYKGCNFCLVKNKRDCICTRCKLCCRDPKKCQCEICDECRLCSGCKACKDDAYLEICSCIFCEDCGLLENECECEEEFDF